MTQLVLQESKEHSPAAAAMVTDGFQPRAAWQLARLLFVGLPLLRFFFLLGLILVPVAVIGYQYSRAFAFGIAIYLCITALGIPYIGAVPQLRKLLSNQRLCLLPGFAFSCVMLVLLLATLLAAALPLAMWICGVPISGSTLGMHIFTVATLYAGFTYAGMSWSRGNWLFSILPMLLLGGVHLLNRNVPGWWLYPPVQLGSFGLSVAAWAWALIALRGRQRFGSVLQGSLQAAGSGNDYQQQIAYQPWLYRLQQMPSPETLLLGFPGSWRGRVQNFAFILLLSPLICAGLFWFLGRIGKGMASWFDLLLLFHFFMTAFMPFAWGELAARSRSLWLRHGSQRASLWQFLEAQLWRNYLLMFAFSALLASLKLLHVDTPEQRPSVLLLLALAYGGALHNGYYSLMVRLRHWNVWQQILYFSLLIPGLGLLVITLRESLPAAWALVGSPVLLLLAAGYRHLAKHSFRQVDWLKLKPLRLSRNTAGG